MSIAEIEKRRADRKATLQAQADEQREKDLEALDAAEVEHGDTNVCRVDVSYTPGLPTMAIARKPKAVELKRFRTGQNITPGEKLDLVAGNEAADLLGRTVRVYPDEETFAQMCAARPDLASTLGSHAVKLAGAKAAEDAKS